MILQQYGTSYNITSYVIVHLCMNGMRLRSAASCNQYELLTAGLMHIHESEWKAAQKEIA